METHTLGTEECTREEHKKREAFNNGHSNMLRKILRLGESDDKQPDRIATTMRSTNSGVATLSGLRKDHKKVTNVNDTPLRPVSNCCTSLSHNISWIISKICDNIIQDDHKTSCLSTEEMLHLIETFNSKINQPEHQKDLVIGSMDVEKLYPSLEANKAGEIIQELISKSEWTFNDINKRELVKYIAVNTLKTRDPSLHMARC